VSPVPPLDLRLSGTVEARAARRHVGPETVQPKASTDPQSAIPSLSRSTSSTPRWSSAPDAADGLDPVGGQGPDLAVDLGRGRHRGKRVGRRDHGALGGREAA
jgi:hypothetical protein